MNRFDNKIVVVTGGNSGIGLGTARRFAAEGARVILVGRDAVTLEAARRELGPDAVALQADLGRTNEVRRIGQAIGRITPHIDVLFANAGVTAAGPIETVTEDSWDQVMNVNLKGVFFLIQSVLPLMSEGSSIIVTSSVSAVRPGPRAAASASKAGLRAMTGSLARELGARGIRVNTLTPGFVDTPILHRTVGFDPQLAAGFARAAVAAAPLKRAGTPEDCATAVLYLASADSAFVTGTEIVVDGGTTGPV